MNPWSAFFIGLFLGVALGVVILVLVSLAREKDRAIERIKRGGGKK